MIRFYLKLTVFMLALLALPVLLIQARPYDDHELRALLMPENCEMPCFMGIRPGLTTIDEAMRLLKVSGWVNWIGDEQTAEGQYPYFEFSWDGHQPDFIDGSDAGIIKVSPNVESGKADLVGSFGFNLKARLSVGEIYTLWGKPAVVHFGMMSFDGDGNIISMDTVHEYPSTSISFTAYSSCPLNYDVVLNSPIYRITYTIWPSQEDDLLPMMKYLLYTPGCG